jgi:hypothetical protein
MSQSLFKIMPKKKFLHLEHLNIAMMKMKRLRKELMSFSKIKHKNGKIKRKELTNKRNKFRQNAQKNLIEQ